MYLLIAVLLLLFITTTATDASNEKHNILYISSYSPSFMTFNDQIDGLRSILKEECNLSIQYMDSKEFYSEALISDFEKQLRKKMQMTRFDLVVVADDNAYNFAMSEKNDLLKDLPIVFLGVNNQKNALKANDFPEVTGVIEYASIDQTINIGLKLQSEAEKIYVLVDPTPSGQGDLEKLKSIMDQYPSYEFQILDTSEISFDVLSERLEDISSEDLILFLSLYRDYTGKNFLFSESVDFVLNNSHVPIFHPYKHGIGEGMVGGHVVDHYQQGRFAGLLVKDYFSQGSLKGISVIEKSPNTYYFDAKVMRSYGLTLELLPEDAIIINNDLSFVEEYRNYIIAFIILFILEGMLIFYLLYNLKKRRAYEKELVETNNLLEMQNEEIKAQYTELEETKVALDISRSRYELAFEGSNSGLFDIDFVSESSYINAHWYNEYLEVPLKNSDDFSKIIDLIPLESRKDYQALKDKIYRGNHRVYDLEFFIHVNGSTEKRWVLENGVLIRNDAGEVIRVIGSHREITHLKRNIQKIENLKVYDQLTKLYNRSALELHLKNILTEKEYYPIGIVLVDLDNFKYINDQYGHHRGDQILKIIGNRMMQNNIADYISRFGGDEYVLVLNAVDSMDQLIEALYNIKSIIEKNITIQNNAYHMRASFGIALSPNHGKDCNDLIRKADLAMYHVKNSEDNNWYRIYDESLDRVFNEKITRIQEITQGIKNSEFYMVFQPIMDVTSKEIVSVEALMRWEHNGLMISPNEFIPLAEKSGLIYELGLISILESIKCLQVVKGLFNVSINLSPIQLKDPNLMVVLKETIETYDVPYEKIIIEVTETAVIEDFNITLKVLQEMKSLGLRIAFDDFGTGYSSLSYLTKLPVDILKIDKSFIQLINEKEENLELIKGIVAIANSRNLEVVFEGVETKEQLNYIISSGCRYAQGYYYYKPMPLEELEKYLDSKY